MANKLEQFDINNENKSKEIKNTIQKEDFKVSDIQEKKV